MPANSKKGSVALKLVLVLLVLAGIAAAYVFGFQTSARVYAVKRDRAVDAVTGSVLIHADGGIFELKSEAAGKVVWCEAIDPGYSFKKGERMVELDSTELKRVIAKTKRDFEAARERARIRLQDDPTRKVAAEQLENAKRLFGLGAATEEQVRALERALAEIDKNLRLTKFDDEKAEVDFKHTMEDMDLQLERMTIRAPFDGKVEGALTRVGAIITVGQPVAQIFSNKRVVAAKISEENFGRVRIGQPAKLRLLTYGSEEFDATVSKLLPTADEAQRFTVYLDVQVDPERLKPNSTGEVTITVAQRENQQVIPRRALLNGDQVMVVKNGRVEVRKVVVGFVALNVVEIREGLQDGELVIVENHEQFRAGKRVRTDVVK